jgi:hypothetical protein
MPNFDGSAANMFISVNGEPGRQLYMESLFKEGIKPPSLSSIL